MSDSLANKGGPITVTPQSAPLSSTTSLRPYYEAFRCSSRLTKRSASAWEAIYFFPPCRPASKFKNSFSRYLLLRGRPPTPFVTSLRNRAAIRRYLDGVNCAHGEKASPLDLKHLDSLPLGQSPAASRWGQPRCSYVLAGPNLPEHKAARPVSEQAISGELFFKCADNQVTLEPGMMHLQASGKKLVGETSALTQLPAHPVPGFAVAAQTHHFVFIRRQLSCEFVAPLDGPTDDVLLVCEDGVQGRFHVAVPQRLFLSAADKGARDHL